MQLSVQNLLAALKSFHYFWKPRNIPDERKKKSNLFSSNMVAASIINNVDLMGI